MWTPRARTAACGALLLFDALLCAAIIAKVRYTEIDWVAYMQEVEGYLAGERDYSKLRGDTGPCVYPALFLYLFSALHYVTSQGTNIKLAQSIFAGIYLAQLGAVCVLYARCGGEHGGVGGNGGAGDSGGGSNSRNSSSNGEIANAVKKAVPPSSAPSLLSRLAATLGLTRPPAGASWGQGQGLPPWCFAALALSKRVHSIYVLRMFNDTVAVLLGALAMLLFSLPSPRGGAGKGTKRTPTSTSTSTSTSTRTPIFTLAAAYRSLYAWRYHLGCLLYSLAVGVKMVSAFTAFTACCQICRL